ncbi:Transcriptional regulator, CdaR family [Modestobacter italicus]|uniref:Transcriptional regulator, CdaR family n=1 Tax=Modestobacter italicus (strain DSM 44449 / CECT 9708 / BC 501) TaxID=2732864 RepID=I4EYN0_MODI5|nr:PucR family transcriptional regulator [Modestobacter marinus]CCH88493.1 Transcriptional regulator, CdaR family [Modestobacter marinus]
MRLTLGGALRHPSLRPGQPRLLTGTAGLQRRVRWVHSSEVLEIASLLRGGELLLTGGAVLAGASAADQRRYITELADRHVTAVAIETGPRLPAVPPAVVSQADVLGFPVIQLRRQIPFVDVAEAVNAELVDASVTRLRHGGQLAHELSAVLADGGDVTGLLETLVQRTSLTAALFDSSGELLSEVLAAHAPEGLRTGPHHGVTSRITVRGAHAATLVFHPRADTDLDLLGVVTERAAEALGLALLRSQGPSTRDLAASELARLAGRATQDRARLAHLAQVVGLSPADPVVGLTVLTAVPGAGLPGLDGLLRPHGRTAMDTSDTEVSVVLSLTDRRRAGTHRAELVAGLVEWARELDGVVVGVGPVVADLAAVSTSMGLAVAALRQRTAYGPGSVVDAATLVMETLLDGDASPTARARFVRGQLSMLLALRPNDAELLMHTLETYLDSGCNKTAAAALLHLQRQSLYGRLERAFGLLGGDPTGTPRALPLHLALRLRHGLGQLAGEHAS